MSGKAVQQDFRGHLLVSQCLTKQITAKVIEDEPDFGIMTSLDILYTLAKGECMAIDGCTAENSQTDKTYRKCIKINLSWVAITMSLNSDTQARDK